MQALRLRLPSLRRDQIAMPPARASAIALYLLIAIGCWAVYRWSPGYPQICDSRYTLIVTERLLDSGRLDMDRYYPSGDAVLPPYHFVRLPHEQAGHVYYGYPSGSSVLALPFVAVWRYLDGPAVADPLKRDEVWQMRLSAIVAAGCAGWTLLLARQSLGWKPAIAVTLFWAFASPLWSTVSRGLWSHDGLVWFLGLALVIVAKLDLQPVPNSGRRRVAAGLLLGSCLFWMFACRPQGAISIVAILGYLLAYRRKELPVVLVALAVWGALFVGFSWYYFGQPMPPSVYSAATPDGSDLSLRALGLLLSPSRGLLIFCPALLQIGWIIARYLRTVPGRRLLAPALLVCAGHFGMMMCFDGWHGGSCYGPRYFADILPWFCLLSVLATRAVLDSSRHSQIGMIVGRAALALCVGWSGFVHARGAMSPSTWRWNLRRERDPQGAPFDWRHPQFLEGLHREPAAP